MNTLYSSLKGGSNIFQDNTRTSLNPIKQRIALQHCFLSAGKNQDQQDNQISYGDFRQDYKATKESPPKTRHLRNLSSNVENQTLKQQLDDKQNYFVGFDERRRQREKQIINSYFKNSSTYNPQISQTLNSSYNQNSLMGINPIDQLENTKLLNYSIGIQRDISPYQLTKGINRLRENFDVNNMINKNDSLYNSKQLSKILQQTQSQNHSPIKLAPIIVQQQKKLRFEDDKQKDPSLTQYPFQKQQNSTSVSRNISPDQQQKQQSVKKQRSISNNQNGQRSLQLNEQSINKSNSNNPFLNTIYNNCSNEKNSLQIGNQNKIQLTQTSVQYQPTINTQPSFLNINFINDNDNFSENIILIDQSMSINDINPQLYDSYCKEQSLPIINETENSNECDYYQIKLKTLNSQDFRSSNGNGLDMLSIDGSTAHMSINLSPFPTNYIKRRMIGKGGYSKIYLCERKLDDKIFACKEVDFSKEQKAKELFENELEFYQCFMRNNQVIDYFSKEIGFKFIPSMEHHEILFNHMTNIEYGYLITEILQKPMRKRLFDVRKVTVGGEEIYDVYLKPLYSHLVDEVDNLKRFIKDIAEFIKFLQANKWTHGDLRLDNIVISSTQIGGSEFLDSFKVIDYGSSFRSNQYKNISSHITPEYMPPEFLKHIISDKFEQEQLEEEVDYDVTRYAVDPEATSSLDIWSLGCMILELLIAVPLWVPQRCRVKQKNHVVRGLFATKERKIEQIYYQQKKFLKQYQQIMKQLKIGSFDKQIKTIVDGCLKPNPRDRLTPEQILLILNEKEENSL